MKPTHARVPPQTVEFGGEDRHASAFLRSHGAGKEVARSRPAHPGFRYMCCAKPEKQISRGLSSLRPKPMSTQPLLQRTANKRIALPVRVEAEVQEGRPRLTRGEVEWPLRVCHDRGAVVYCGDLACITFQSRYGV